MSPKVPWTPDVVVGVSAIDDQHKELFDRLNTCFDSIAKEAKRAEIAGTIGFLRAYVMKHFRDEEKLQRQVGYPGFEAHKKEHDLFEVKLQELSKVLIKDGPTAEFLKEFESLTVTWLINHIKVRDMEIAKFVEETKRVEPEKLANSF